MGYKDKTKMIASSVSLLNYLNLVDGYRNDFITLIIKDGKFKILGLPHGLDVEHSWDIEMEYPYSQIKKLAAFLKSISEQPVTLGFCSNGWITIHEADITP